MRVDELVRDNDAAIEARVQALAAAVAAESNAVQPDFALIDCLRQQIIDMRTIQDNMHHFLVGASAAKYCLSTSSFRRSQHTARAQADMPAICWTVEHRRQVE